MNGHTILALFHIFLVVPLFLYIAFVRSDTPLWLFRTVTVLGIIILIYHAYKIVLKWNRSPSVWVNILHVLAIAPLLIYIGTNGTSTPRWAFEILAMEGFAALGYHIYGLILEVQEVSKKYQNQKEMKEKETMLVDS